MALSMFIAFLVLGFKVLPIFLHMSIVFGVVAIFPLFYVLYFSFCVQKPAVPPPSGVFPRPRSTYRELRRQSVAEVGSSGHNIQLQKPIRSLGQLPKVTYRAFPSGLSDADDRTSNAEVKIVLPKPEAARMVRFQEPVLDFEADNNSTTETHSIVAGSPNSE